VKRGGGECRTVLSDQGEHVKIITDLNIRVKRELNILEG
jgi:hypothetical protein